MTYGLHTASHAKTRLERARHTLTPAQAPCACTAPIEERPDWRDLLRRLSGIDVRVCPACHQRALVRTALTGPRCRAPPETA
ncbi:MAG TPA: hypothetical protein VM925_15200 [Labilithrix sp.]|nr:hypothetical protein [Labilithrix sp.]